MKKITFLVPVLALAIAFSSLLFISARTADDESFGAGNQPNLITGSLTHATSSVGTTRVKLLDADTGRQYVRVDRSPAATTTLYLYMVPTSASTTVLVQGGIPISTTSVTSIVIDESNLYTGEIWAIADDTQTVYVTTN